MLDNYIWIVILSGISAFFAAFGIGANDAANAFASSVGSKALSLGQAVILASIFEFSGSILIGSQVTDTIRSKIIDVKQFSDPALLMYGMMCAVISVSIWLILATYLEMPVSTTNSTLAGVIGIGLVQGGTNSIVWYKYDSSKDFLNKFSGVTPIFISWIISPIMAGLISSFLFWITREYILRPNNSLYRSYIFFPFLVSITITINVYFILYKGIARKIDGLSISEYMGDGYVSLTAWGFGLVIGMLMYIVFVKWLKQYHANWNNHQEKAKEHAIRIQEQVDSLEIEIASQGFIKSIWLKIKVWWKNMFSKNLHADVLEDEHINNIHQNAEIFNDKTENTFSYVQVFTACMDSFAHGANDVANSIGPFAAVWSIYDTGLVASKSEVPEWILILGGFGIVCGLALYGAKMIKALGIKISKITPCRGYNIELSSSLVVIIASVYGIPISTTHAQVGSTVGIALIDGYQQTGSLKQSFQGLNGFVMMRVLFGMIATMIFVAGLSAALFSFGAYSPNQNGY